MADYIDFYCERTTAAFMDEPINALSNASFFIAAWLLYSLYKKAEHNNPAALLLIALIAAIGMGSSAFHLFATTGTLYLDVLPITAFIFVYLWLSMRRLLGYGIFISITGLIAFFIVSELAGMLPAPYHFNHSAGYFPCVLALLLMSLPLRKRNPFVASVFIKASVILSISLFFRTVDMAICGWFPVGVHFLWHVLNGVVLFILAKAFLLADRKN